MPEIVGVDSETNRIRDGMLAPRPVVWSFADATTEWLERGQDAFDVLHGLARRGVTWATSNFPFDAAVAGARDRDLLLKLFDKLEWDEIFDVEVAATLDAIAEGRMGDKHILDRDGQPLRSANGGATNRIRLENSVWIYLGRKNAKENDEYRTRYGQLASLPLEVWPTEAVQYPKDDARNQLDCAVVQRRVCKNIGPIGDGLPRLPAVKMTHMALNMRAFMIMHLGSVFGIRSDEKRILELEAVVAKARADGDAQFRKLNFIKTEPHEFTRTGNRKDDDGKDNGTYVKRCIVLAFGGRAEDRCPKCLPYWETCGVGRGPFGKAPKPTKAQEKAGITPPGNAVKCKECDGTGLVIPPGVPRSDGGGVSGEKDILLDSGNADLVAWAEFGTYDKLEQTYLPWLRKGIKHPINVRANILVNTGRTSYDGLLQLIPPLARECIIAPPGYDFCSIDLAAGELCTLAQVQYWVLDRSTMGDVINATKDPGALHTQLGAKMGGVDLGDDAALAAFALQTKDKTSRAYALRQLAKIGNFGFPGLMGPPKLVVSARRKGDRLCVISGLNKACKPGVMMFKGRELDRPTCPDCLEVAAQLRVDWLATWPEMQAYFDWVKRIPGVKEEMGTIVTPGTGYIRGGLNPAAAANHSFQHLLAYAKKHAMWLVGKEAYCDKSSPLYGTKVIGDIHDELLTLIPRTPHQHEAAFRKKELIIQGVKAFLPDVAVVADDPALMDRWLKKATAVYDGVPTPTRPKGTIKTWHPETKKAS